MQASGLITDVKSIADRVKEARQKLGWSQARLAKEAGVSQGTIGNIESGMRKQPRELLSLASALNVSPNWLESGKSPETTSTEEPKGQPVENVSGADSTTSAFTRDGRDPMHSLPTIGATIVHLAALMAAISPMGRKSIAPLLASIADQPELAVGAAKMADAIASSQHVETSMAEISRALNMLHAQAVETDLSPLGKK